MESNNKQSSKEEESKKLNFKEKQDRLRQKTSEKIIKLKELIRSLGLNNIDEIMRFLENIESALDGLDTNELEKVAQKIQDEILISIEKDNKLQSGVKLQFALLLNGDNSTSETYDPDDDQFAYL
ncbi:MAG: hypothetical protein PHS92_02890 [Candidatus Gracilibacteria bacterium]|nr:hypothetical protein [Candidatus Gracilibacteria bacterium]